MNGGPATRTLTRCSASKRSELCRSFAICCPLFILSAWRSWRAPKHARLARFRGDALVLPAPPRRAAGGHGRRVESTGSVARPTGCHLFRGIGRHELLTIAPGVCRWRRCALRCARTPPARAHARALPTDADADREIAALTKKIAADEASLVEDRKVILRHARSTSPAPPRSCLTRLCGPTLAAALHESAHARARAPGEARAAARDPPATQLPEDRGGGAQAGGENREGAREVRPRPLTLTLTLTLTPIVTLTLTLTLTLTREVRPSPISTSTPNQPGTTSTPNPPGTLVSLL